MWTRHLEKCNSIHNLENATASQECGQWTCICTRLRDMQIKWMSSRFEHFFPALIRFDFQQITVLNARSLLCHHLPL